MTDVDRLERVATFAKIFGECSTLEEVCRAIVQSKEFAGTLLGTQIHSLSRRGHFVSVAVFGKEAHPETEQLWFFDDHPIAHGAAKREVVVEPHPADEAMEIWTMPIIKDKSVVGAISSVCHKGAILAKLNAQEVISVSSMAYLFLSLTGMPEIVKDTEDAASGELTKRQHEIIMMMGKGMTNVQIAKELILSESSIKQESVKIFRSLGVGNRRDAVKRARNSGLIPDQQA